MTGAEIVDAVVLDRFPTSMRPRALIALNNRLGHLWRLESWTFRYATASPTTAANDNTLNALPADFGVVEDLWNDLGDKIAYLVPSKFYSLYLPVTYSTPEAYTVVNQEIRLGPTPTASATWTLSYRKRLTEIADSASAVTVIPSELHSALVHGGRAELLAAYNDPTAGDMEQQWQLDLEAARRDWLVDVDGQPAVWGSDPTGAAVW